METILDIFSKIRTRKRDRPLLRYRNEQDDWDSMTVSEFEKGVFLRAKYLDEIGVKPDSDIALISENRPEWHLYDFAVLGLGASTVPIHANMSPEQTAYVLNDSESTHLILSNEKLLSKVLKGLKETGNLKQIIILDSPEETTPDNVISEDEFLSGANNYSAEELETFWKKKRKQVRPDDLATLIYTSGTTGEPKGVMLTHHNIVANIKSCHQVVQFQQSDVGLSFLPLSHAFERMVDYAYFYCGSQIAYGTPDTITEDLKEVKPTILASVPRLFEKIKTRVDQKMEEAGSLKKSLFQWAVDAGYQASAQYHIDGEPLDPWLKFKRWMANTFVLRPIRKAMGGNLRMIISGGAALDESICRFFLGLSVPILEGYGMTEMSPVVALNRPRSIRPGTVGPAVPDVEIKIDRGGEVLCRGPNMMRGYYHKHEESVEALQGGWFHTGDLGKLDNEGNLIIHGREKYSIVTSWGENIVPQPLERELRQSPFIEHAVMYGHNRNFVSALIQPDFDNLQTWAKKKEIDFGPRRELANDERVIEKIQQELQQIQEDWADYEKIKQFRLLPDTLTVKKGDLTPTMKVRRHILKDKYSNLIEEMYREEEPEEAHDR